VSTSGAYNYLCTASDIITASFEDLGVISAGQTVDSADSATALRTLQMLAKQWMGTTDFAPGLKSWTRYRLFLFFAYNQGVYYVGPGTTDDNATTGFRRYTVATAQTSGNNTVVVADSSVVYQPDLADAPTLSTTYKIGIQLDGSPSTMQWTTINGAPVDGGTNTTITLTANLTGNVAAGNYIYVYQTKPQRPIEIETVTLLNSANITMPIRIYTDVGQYEDVNQKTALGDPLAILVEPLQTNTRITTNYYPYDVTKQLRFQVYYPTQNYDSTANDIEYPQQWYAALEWELAFRLAPKYGAPWSQEAEQNRQRAVAIAQQQEPARSSLYFQAEKDY
jgi:hypothetical protein